MDPHLHNLSQQLDNIPDTGERAAARTRVIEQLRRFQAEQKTKRQTDVRELREQLRLTFTSIGEIIGTTRGRAKQIHDGDSSNAGQRRSRAAKEADTGG
jgi:cytochrome c556